MVSLVELVVRVGLIQHSLAINLHVRVCVATSCRRFFSPSSGAEEEEAAGED